LQTAGHHGSKGRSPYFALMSVLNKLVDIPIFFIFLSTNSSLNAFAPRDAYYPSLRVRLSGQKLIPPFFELPFDAFCGNSTPDAKKGKLTLNGVCGVKQMVKFGRPMCVYGRGLG
jgi:hypothetical protein